LDKERKLQIIKAAQKRFVKHGVHKTTLDEIARDLRIGKATIYHYFTSKDDLFFETLRRESFNYIEEVKDIFNNETIEVNQRFIEYLSFKENLDQRHKLIYDLVILNLKESTFEVENSILKDLLEKEEEILKLFLSSIYREKIETFDPNIPSFIALQSWGFLLGIKTIHPQDQFKQAKLKEILVNYLLKLLTPVY
jgi:AcrR family transcriptional regulator